MKTSTFLLSILMTIILSSCESKQDVQSDIDRLRAERTTLQNETSSLNTRESQQHSEIAILNQQLTDKEKELSIYKNGKLPKYILKIHLKQTHFTLSIKEHIKDAMNAIDFELPVDKDFYEQVSTGTAIVDQFRTGSLFLRGSFGSWEMTVSGKEIR